MAVHVAVIAIQNVSPAGIVKRKTEMTIGEVARSNSEARVMEDAAIPNTTGSPTIQAYLELEEAEGYTLRHMDQTYIVTYN